MNYKCCNKILSTDASLNLQNVFICEYCQEKFLKDDIEEENRKSDDKNIFHKLELSDGKIFVISVVSVIVVIVNVLY